MIRVTIVSGSEKVTINIDERQKIIDILNTMNEKNIINLPKKYSLHLILEDKKCRSDRSLKDLGIKENEIIKIIEL